MRQVLMVLSFLAAVFELAPAVQAAGGEAIDICVQSERAAGSDGLSCIGKLANPCLNRPENVSTVAQYECIRKETVLWDDMLNAEYKRLRGLLGSEKKRIALRDVQRLWIKYRDADCGLARVFYDGGTISTPIAANCVLHKTARRAIEILVWREDMSPR